MTWLLFVAGVVAYCGLYSLLRAHLVRSVCRHVLQRSGKGSVRLSEAEVSDITVKVISAAHALWTSVVGLVVMWETADDCIYSRSQKIVPFTHVAMAYLLCDLVAMYCSHCQSRNIPTLRGRSLLRFVESKLFLVIHHLLLVLVGYPFIVYPSLRREMGDFLFGTLFIREMSSPLLAVIKILRRLQLNNTLVYRVNGAALIVVFFLVRIANTPLTLLFFAAQHHSWSLLQALFAMRLICHVFLVGEFILQTYWFTLLLMVALRHKSS